MRMIIFIAHCLYRVSASTIGVSCMICISSLLSIRYKSDFRRFSSTVCVFSSSFLTVTGSIPRNMNLDVQCLMDADYFLVIYFPLLSLLQVSYRWFLARGRSKINREDRNESLLLLKPMEHSNLLRIEQHFSFHVISFLAMSLQNFRPQSFANYSEERLLESWSKLGLVYISRVERGNDIGTRWQSILPTKEGLFRLTSQQVPVWIKPEKLSRISYSAPVYSSSKSVVSCFLLGWTCYSVII